MENLKLLRNKKGVSQQKLADAIGCNQQSIHKYEKGDYEPDIQTLTLLADYFETSIDFLVGRTEVRRKIESINEYTIRIDEEDLIDKYRNFSKEQKELISKIINATKEMKTSD